jgi:hypothetical protein
MSEKRNPRVHAEILPALAAVDAPIIKILAIGSVTAKGKPEAITSLAADPNPLGRPASVLVAPARRRRRRRDTSSAC